jgi:hypothetical protein
MLMLSVGLGDVMEANLEITERKQKSHRPRTPMVHADWKAEVRP